VFKNRFIFSMWHIVAASTHDPVSGSLPQQLSGRDNLSHSRSNAGQLRFQIALAGHIQTL
jgi:hypothetical protein